jgi:hypothetical protein
MATSLSLQNDASLAQGYVKVNGTTSATFTTSGITGNLVGNVTGSLTQGGSVTLATAQTASGTAVDFTGIPSWAKRITVMFNGVSTNGSSRPLIQIGSVSIQTTGYSSASRETTVTGTGFPVYNTGFVIESLSSTNLITGHMALTLISPNIFVSSHCFYFNQSGNTFEIVGAGSVSLSGALDRLRITTVNGTDTFDAGTINISYEG